MKKILLILAAVLAVAACGQKETIDISKPCIIFETDMGNDVDDALALDILYKYLDADKINLLAITLNKEGTAPAEFIDIMGTFYGYPDIPVGIIKGGADCETDAINYAKAVVNLKNEDGTPLFPRSHSDYANYPEAHKLYRKILAEMPDNSVTVVSVGFSTNLQRLLETPGDEYSPLTGRELVAKKVKGLCTMAGCMNNPEINEYNVWKDVPAAKKVFTEWPTNIVTSPFEVGIAITYPGESIEKDFSWAEHHPMVEAYKAYLPMPYDRPTWDLTSVLYVVENSQEFFTESPKGTLAINETGGTTFTENPEGNISYLLVDEQQAKNVKDHFVSLITTLPEKYK